jgi:hypothetical protein
VFVYDSLTNVGGIGRFYAIKHLLIENNFQYCIFIDDDQIFGSQFIETMKKYKKIKTGFCWYGKTFDENKKYKNNTHLTLKHKDKLDYGGTGGMIIDVEIFKNNDFYKNLPPNFLFCEDLWLSLYGQKYYNYSFYKIDVNMFIIKDGKDQCTKLWKTKENLIKIFN